MKRISEELLSEDLDGLLEQLEKDDDIENSLLILQLIEENLDKEITEENTPANLARKELKTKLDSAIEGFMSRPAEFFGLDAPFDEYVEDETGFQLLPKTKEERSRKATEIIQEIAAAKIKKKKLDKEIDMKKAKTRAEIKEKLQKAKRILQKRKEAQRTLDSSPQIC